MLFLFSTSTNNNTPMSPSNQPHPSEPNSTEPQNPFVVPLPLHISSNESCYSSTPIIVNSSSQMMNINVNRSQNNFLPDVSVWRFTWHRCNCIRRINTFIEKHLTFVVILENESKMYLFRGVKHSSTKVFETETHLLSRYNTISTHKKVQSILIWII